MPIALYDVSRLPDFIEIIEKRLSDPSLDQTLTIAICESKNASDSTRTHVSAFSHRVGFAIRANFTDQDLMRLRDWAGSLKLTLFLGIQFAIIDGYGDMKL